MKIETRNFWQVRVGGWRIGIGSCSQMITYFQRLIFVPAFFFVFFFGEGRGLMWNERRKISGCQIDYSTGTLTVHQM